MIYLIRLGIASVVIYLAFSFIAMDFSWVIGSTDNNHKARFCMAFIVLAAACFPLEKISPETGD